MSLKINWFGLAGGIVTLGVVVASLYVPWWQIAIGELGSVGVSPVFTNAALLGTALTMPLLWALNITGLLLLIASGAIMMVYSLLPNKPYSKHLLGFAYKKPLFMVIFFIIPLIAVVLILQAALSVNFPLNGTANIALPMSDFGVGITISFLVSAGFLWTFWLAVVAAGLCLAARLYHGRVSYKPEPKPADSAPVPPAAISARATATDKPRVPSEPTKPKLSKSPRSTGFTKPTSRNRKAKKSISS